jgi:xanthine dehydrogenase accessory factor
MTELLRQARHWLAEGRRVELIEVVDARGSVPREAGTRMLVSAEATAGTIGGGHLEWQAIAQARERLASGGVQPATLQHLALGPALGQCCGGAVSLRYSTLNEAALRDWPATPVLFHLQLYGAGHVGRAIVQALSPLPVSVDWIDEREDAFPPAPVPTMLENPGPADALAPNATGAQVNRLCVDAVEAEVRHAPAGAFYLVLTHQHALDWRIACEILRRGDFGFFGLIGSRTKRQRFVHRFEQMGLPTSQVARMTCPIGVPGIVGKEPEVIAAAVVAQLLQHASLARESLGDQTAASALSLGTSSTRTV